MRPIAAKKTNCLHDLRILSGHRSLWSCTRSLRSIQFSLTRWWRSRFRHKIGPSSICERPTETVLEGWNKSKFRGSVQLLTVLAVYEKENVRNNEPPNYSRLKTTVRRHIDQTVRTHNFRAWNEIVEIGAVTKSQKGRRVSVERKVGECYQWKCIWTVFERRLMQFQSWWSICKQMRSETQRTIVLFCTTSADTDWRKETIKNGSGLRGQSPFGKGGRIACRNFLRRKCTNPSCNYGHPPVCLNYKSESGCKYGEKCRFRHAELMGSAVKSWRKVVWKDQLLYWRGLFNWDVSSNSPRAHGTT